MNFSEMKEKIQNESLFKLWPYADDALVLVSTGIKMMMEENENFRKDVKKSLERFQKGDFGTIYCFGEEASAGNEYGEYETSLNENIYIHRKVTTTHEFTVYFDFER